MKSRPSDRLAALALLILASLSGCFGSSEDKGDNPGAGVGTARKENVDAAKTGGMGENRPGVPVGPGDTGPPSASAPGTGPK